MVRSFTIATTTPNALCAEIHNRMPVILPLAAWPIWLGALQEKSASGARVHVFKSWAQRRRADPKHILLERRFKHPLISRSTIKAARALRPLQGRKGLYFSGHYTTGMDLQESALYSAMQVAEALAPGSRTLAALKTRLSARGLAGISYDL